MATRKLPAVKPRPVPTPAQREAERQMREQDHPLRQNLGRRQTPRKR